METRDKTTITMKDMYTEATIIHNNVDLCITEVRDSLLIPLLLAMGYHHETVKSLFFDENEEV